MTAHRGSSSRLGNLRKRPRSGGFRRHSVPGARTHLTQPPDGWLRSQSSLNMTDRRKGLGRNHGAEQEGHIGPFHRARAAPLKMKPHRGEAQSLLRPLVPLRGQAAPQWPRAHKPQHPLAQGSPKHGEPSILIPQTSKPSVGYTTESSGRTTMTSLASLLLSAPV